MTLTIQQQLINSEELCEKMFYNDLDQSEIVKALIDSNRGGWYVFNNTDDEGEDDENYDIQFAYVIKDQYTLEHLRNYPYMLIYEFCGTYWFIKESYGVSLGDAVEMSGLYEYLIERLVDSGAMWVYKD